MIGVSVKREPFCLCVRENNMNTNPYEPPKSEIADDLDKPSAFTCLFDLSYTRSLKQAMAFYLIYFILLLILGAFSGIVSALVFGGGEQTGFIAGVIVSIVSCTVLSVTICLRKSLFTSYVSILLIVATIIASGTFGALLGLIPVSYLSTRDSNT